MGMPQFNLAEGKEFYSPGEVANKLEVSTANLRRMARHYEDIVGPLPRDNHGDRLYPVSALERLFAARVLYSRGEVQTIRAALSRLERDEKKLQTALKEASEPKQLDLLMSEVQALRDRVTRLEVELEAVKLRQNTKSVRESMNGTLDPYEQIQKVVQAELQKKGFK